MLNGDTYDNELKFKMIGASVPKVESRLEVICGPMFAGKTEELIRRLRRAVFAQQTILVLKPEIDTRYGTVNITSHANLDLEIATGIKPTVISCDINQPFYQGEDVVAFDEAQFFGPEIVHAINYLLFQADKKVRVICAGLDLDRDGNPYGQMPQLLAMADEPVKITAICSRCKGIATRSYYLGPKSDEQNIVGGAKEYEARCKSCWYKAK